VTEKLDIMKKLIDEKKNRRPEVYKKLKHYQSDYHFWRFGEPYDR
jgi:hypothetical protein